MIFQILPSFAIFCLEKVYFHYRRLFQRRFCCFSPIHCLSERCYQIKSIADCHLQWYENNSSVTSIKLNWAHNHINTSSKQGDGYEKISLAHGFFLIPMIGIFLVPVLSSDQ